MHGHGYAPPQPGRPADGTLIALRVVFIALTVLSCSFLAWTPMLRLAILTRKALDWALLVTTLLSSIGIMVFLGIAVPEDEDELSDATALTFLGWVTVVMVGVIAYYVTAESRHYERVAPRLHQVTGYGYPPVAQPPVPNPYAQQRVQPPVPQQYTPPAHQPPAAAEPQQQHHPRIDQVRAELDELSDILRKSKDQREGGR
ncbi:hypothetical protein [Streptomyces sp. NPDC002133]|uniref:hypothetical protein n=1 Tax=Streptomyces sp. NPDC002133 TaxID=3154409 RepID=UPI003332CB57